MDRQRRGEPDRHRRRRAGRLGRLALAGLITLAACAGEAGLLVPRDGGVSGRGSSASPLIGRWEATLYVDVGADVQLWTTEWTFRADGTCDYRQTVLSVVAGTTVKFRPCAWSTSSGVLRVVYADTGALYEAAFSFPTGLRDSVVIQGVAYRRTG